MNTEIEIRDYKFDGDAEGLKFLQLFIWDEFETMRYAVDNMGKANLYDSAHKKHFEVTKAGNTGIYMVAEIGSSSSSWF